MATVKIIEAKTFKACIRMYSLFKIESLEISVQLPLHKVMIRSVTTYVCPA
jgi:hypothetical protein